MRAAIITIVLTSLLILIPLLATLYYTGIFKASPKKRKSILDDCFIGCFGVLFFALMLHNMVEPQIKRLFYKGSIVQKEKWQYPDEGEPYLDTVDDFEYNGVYSANDKGIATFITLVVFIGGLGLTYYYKFQNDRISEETGDDKYEGLLEGKTGLIVLRIVLAIGLLVCLLNMPYLYYQILRWVVVFGCYWLASDYLRKPNFIGWLFVFLLMLLFNPILPVTFEKLVWNCIDITVAVIMLSGAVKSYIDLKQGY